MSVTYNGNPIDTIHYNSVSLEKFLYNTVDVFSSHASVLIKEMFEFQTDFSVVPEPYDNEGYNYNADAPAKTKRYYVDLGDVDNYDSIEFNWDNYGTVQTVGTINGVVGLTDSEQEVPNKSYTIFTAKDKQGLFTLDLKDVSGHKYLCFSLYAKSNSSYRYYGAMAKLTIRNLVAYKTGATPPPEESSYLLLEKASLEAYSNTNGQLDVYRYALEIPNVTPYNKITFNWNNTGSNAPFGYFMGLVETSPTETSSGWQKILYDGVKNQSGTVEIDVTKATGLLTVYFRVEARTDSDNTSWPSRSTLNISNVTIHR